MSIKKAHSRTPKESKTDNSSVPETQDTPKPRRNQVFKEDEFSFISPELEARVMKIVGDDNGKLLMIKQGIFHSGVYAEEYYQEHHKSFEWKTSLKKHDYSSGKYSIDLKLHLNQDFPDIDTLSSGRYRLIFQFYNPSKRRKNHLYGCIDTQSIDFELGDIEEEKKGENTGSRKDPSTPLQELASLDVISQVVSKVGDVLNRTIEIHQSTIMYSEQIKDNAKKEGYETRKQEEEKEKLLQEQNKTIAALTARLDALENAPAQEPTASDGTMNMIMDFLKKLGIIPDIDLTNIPPEKIAEFLAMAASNKQT